MNTTRFQYIYGGMSILLGLLAVWQPVVLVRSMALKDSSEALEQVSALVPAPALSYQDPLEPLVQPQDENILSVEAIIDATNKVRIQEGRPLLRSNPALIASAKAKTLDMVTRGYFEHRSPDGKGVADLAIGADYAYVIVGENLARGTFVSADDLVSEWMKSPGHRDNMLSPLYQEMGAYAARGMYDGKEVWFAVQHFGTDRAVCPRIDTGLKQDIDILNAELSDRRVQIVAEKAKLETTGRPDSDIYKIQVGEFNDLVSQYNITLVLSQEKIKKYNEQVAAFNACLGTYKPVR